MKIEIKCHNWDLKNQIWEKSKLWQNWNYNTQHHNYEIKGWNWESYDYDFKIQN